MNFKFYLEKLENSENFKSFMKENPDAYLCSGFFIIDKQNNGAGDQQHLDYFIPSQKNLISFCISDACQKNPSDLNDKNYIPEELLNYDFNFEEVEKIVTKTMDEKSIKNGIQKILVSLQSKGKKNFLLCTVFISTLGMIRIDISLPEMQVINFEKKSFFDIMKVSKKKD